MNRHALSVLEFPRVLEVVAGRAASALGAARVRALVPSRDRVWIDREHARVAAVKVLRAGDPPFAAEPTPDIGAGLERLRVTGASWPAETLRDALLLLRSAKRAHDALGDTERPAAARAVLAPLRDQLLLEKGVTAALERAIADDATVNDGASPALKRMRREARAGEAELIKVLERQLAKLDDSHRVPDMSVTVRDGRYVIPVRREGRAALGGIVHDASASGGTLFVEPPAAVEFSSKLRELEAAIREEVERILLELTDLLRPHRDSLASTLDALTELDSLHARAAFAETYVAVAPVYAASGESWSIARGRHPLLVAGGTNTVPFDLTLGSEERTLVVSGPNTGGKTVFLKAAGLLCAMAQAGIPPTVAAESRFVAFDDYFADIGDEQSIEASLSTFSGHLRNLAEILRAATADSLVLIDELGSGTDPVEGAALGSAILEDLTKRGARTLASSHLGALKELAATIPGVVNASLEFDAERLAPTYRFVKGVPGRSYGLSIARRLALPENVVASAEERVPRVERDVTSLLQQLESQHAALGQREAELAELLEDGRRRNHRLAERETNVRERERELERQSRSEARKYLLNARAEIDRTVRDLKRAASGELDERARDARKQAESLAAKQADALDALDDEERAARERRPARSPSGAPPGEGDAVLVESLGRKAGRVVSVRGSDAVVAVGSLKLTVPLAGLARAPLQDAVAQVATRGDVPETEARGEVDLRGLRVDEMEAFLFRALDDAIRANLPTLRIIHGKGTGALRDRVTEMLRKDTRVREFRLGAWNEGGSGVTVAELG